MSNKLEVKSTGRFGVHDLASTVNGMIKTNRHNDNTCDVYNVKLAIGVWADMDICIYDDNVHIFIFIHICIYTYVCICI
jgi:hypothetical protein